MKQERSYIVPPELSGERLDLFLAGASGVGRAAVQKWIRSGCAQKKGKVLKNSYRTAEGDQIDFHWEEEEKIQTCPEPIPLTILYEDEFMIVIDKARGMVVHPAPGNPCGTLVNALLYHCGENLPGPDPQRPGIVHRLDKDTSGVMVAAKTEQSFYRLQQEIGSHEARKCYVALVHGQMEADEGVIRYSLGRSPKDRMKWTVEPKTGRPAVTHFHVLERMRKYSWILCRLETGRTHQIRVHMSHIGHPVVQDSLYGWKKDDFPISGQALHSRSLDLFHPVTGEAMHFEAPIPDDLLKCLEEARNDSKT